MSDEDFEPFVGGPPPDPSERTWRHPSEIAAQAHAESMPSPRRATRGPRALLGWRPNNTTGVILAGSLSAAACLAGIAVVQAASAPDPIEVDPVDIAAPIHPDTPIAIGASATARASGLAPTTTVTPAVSRPADTTETTVEPQPATEAVAAAADHHLVPIRVGRTAVANGILIDGYLITSAGAAGDQLSVSYQDSGSELIAYLVGVDPFSDLAVFRPSNESRAGRALQALATSLNAPPSEQAGAAGVTIDTQVTVAGLTDTGLEARPGRVIATDGNGTDPRGHPLIGLLDTNIRQPERPGALLVADDGSIAGIVVNTSSSLASAIPIDDALSIADRLTRQGWANETWIGFVGIDRLDGVEVVDVTENGPAERAGLRPGDVIHLFDGAPIDHMGSVTAGLRRASPGDTIVLVIERGDRLIALEIEAAAYSPDASERVSEPIDG